jgi:hypothetical protein
VTVFAKRTTPPIPAPSTAVQHARGSHLPRLLGSPPSASVLARPNPGLDPTGLAFVRGVDGFCRAWYDGQKRTDERFPTTNARVQYAERREVDVRQVNARLPGLHPPPALAAPFASFVANEAAMFRAIHDEAVDAQSGQTGSGRIEFDAAIERRHELAHALGAAQCDGLLPAAQWRAAVRAVQRFDLTTDPQQFCVTLVTPEFVPGEWSQTGHAMTTCLRQFHIHRLGSLPVPHNVRISSVSGVDGFSATVVYTEVPDCGCGTFTARLT